MTSRHKALLLIPVPIALLLVALGWISFTITQRSLDKLEHIETTLARIDAGLQDQNRVQAYAEGLDLDGLEASYFLRAPSLTIAKASLQERLTDLARRSGLLVKSVRLTDMEDTRPVIAVQLDMSGDLNALSAFLIGVEKSTPHLRSHAFSLTRRRGAGDDQFSIAIMLQALPLINGSDK